MIALLAAALVTFADRDLMGDGVPVEITNDLDPWVFGPEYACPPGATGCSSGPMVLGNDTCNRFVQNVGLDGERVTWGPWGTSTLVGCPDTELQKTFERLRRGEGFVIELADDQLRMSGKDVNLISLAGGPFARTEDPVLDEGAAHDIAYRVTWNGGITVESTDTSTASGIGLVGNSPAADTLSGFFVDLGGVGASTGPTNQPMQWPHPRMQKRRLTGHDRPSRRHAKNTLGNSALRFVYYPV